MTTPRLERFRIRRNHAAWIMAAVLGVAAGLPVLLALFMGS